MITLKPKAMKTLTISLEKNNINTFYNDTTIKVVILLFALLSTFISSATNPVGTNLYTIDSGNWNNTNIWASTTQNGTISLSEGSNQLVGQGTNFTTDFNVGDIILTNTYIKIGTIISINSSTTITFAEASSITYNAINFKISRVPLASDNVLISANNTVNMDNLFSSHFANNLVVHGTLNLLDGANLSVTKHFIIDKENSAGAESVICIGSPQIRVNGNIIKSSSGIFSPAELSIIINSNGVFNLPTVYDLSINATPATILTLQNNLTIENNLNLVVGKIDIGNFSINATNIVGGSSASYVITSSDYNASNAGFLTTKTSSSAETIFPVGTINDYSPCSISNSETPTNYSVRVFDAVYYKGLSGQSLALYELKELVKKTWEINAEAPTNSIISLQWNSVNEGDYFAKNREKARLIKNNHAVNDYTWNPQNSSKVDDLGDGTLKISASINTANSVYGVYTPGSPLPVTLLDFTGEVSNDEVNLSWHTASEINNEYFNLERSFDGQTFSTIASITASGNSNNLKSYSYTDQELQSNSTIYYRLAQVDFNGSTTNSPVISVKIETESNGLDLITVGPNPFNNQLNIQYNSITNENVILKIYDNIGRMVLTNSIAPTDGINSFSLQNTSDLQSGIYFVTLQSGNFTTKTTKLIKR